MTPVPRNHMYYVMTYIKSSPVYRQPPVSRDHLYFVMSYIKYTCTKGPHVLCDILYQ